MVVREPTLRRVQLIGGDANVQQHPVHLLPALGVGNLLHRGEVSLHPDGLGVTGKPLAGSLDGVRILIDGKQAPRCQTLQDGFGMTAATHGAVNVQSLWPNGQGVDGFFKQNRLVMKFHRATPFLRRG